MTNTPSGITRQNRAHYNERYKNVSITGIERTLSRLDAYLDEVTVTDTSWVAMFRNDFRNQLQGKKVLELGCGDCRLVAIMAALGAEVTANDIAETSGDIIAKINASGLLDKPLAFVQGDFLEQQFPPHTFDWVVGKAFVHHLTHEQEAACFLKINTTGLFAERHIFGRQNGHCLYSAPLPGHKR